MAFFNSLTGFEINNPNLEIDQNVSFVLPDNYVAIKFNGSNVDFEGNSCEHEICNSIMDYYDNTFWLGDRNLPIYLIFKLPSYLNISEAKNILTVGGFMCEYILNETPIEIVKDGQVIKNKAFPSIEELETTPYLPFILYPLYEINNKGLVSIKESNEYNIKLTKHMKYVISRYEDVDLDEVLSFINETFLENYFDNSDFTKLKKELKRTINENIYNKNGITKKIEITKLSAIEEKDPIWIFYPYIALSTLVVISGDPGSGKSYFSLYIASVLSNGGEFVNKSVLNAFNKPIKSLILNGEDSAEFVIKKRIRKLGGNPENIYIINEFSDSFKLNYINELENIIKKNDIKLIIIDPIQNYLPAGANMDSAIQMRSCLSPIKDLAEKLECTFLLIMHKNKNTKTKDIYRTLGSIDFIGLSRSALSVEKSDNKTYINHIKNSIGQLGNRLVMEINDNGVSFIDDVTQIDVKSEQYNNAKQIIYDALANGKIVKSVEMLDLIKKNGIPDRIVKKIKNDLNIKDVQVNKKHHWYISNE